MKILVIQLARYGDLYQTLPSLRALRRKHPDAEIHLLVRERFRQAVSGFEEVDAVLTLSTSHILEPIIRETDTVKGCLGRLGEWLGQVQGMNYTNIINLSYSPFSSFLTSAISQDSAQCFGYTRHRDGFLDIPDDGSAYFYAQVGTHKFNRLHLTDVFATVCGVDLAKEDYLAPTYFVSPDFKKSVFEKLGGSSEEAIVIHIGASQQAKSYDCMKWQRVIGGLSHRWQEPIILVGSKEEQATADQIVAGLDGKNIWNWVGDTQLNDLFAILDDAALVIGADSVVMHMATLTGTRSLNLSFSSVNFWETGPLASGSRIILAEDSSALPSDQVVDEACHTLFSSKSTNPVVRRQDTGKERFVLEGYEEDRFAWQLICAIYMGESFPVPQTNVLFQGIQRLHEVVELGLEQMDLMKDESQRSQTSTMIDQVDGVIRSIEGFVPELQPLISWFRTERIRIEPGDLNHIRSNMRTCFENLRNVLSIYVHAMESQDSKKELVDGNA